MAAVQGILGAVTVCHRHGGRASLLALPQAEAAQHEAAVARELAAQREAEAKAAHERELAQIKRAEVGAGRCGAGGGRGWCCGALAPRTDAGAVAGSLAAGMDMHSSRWSATRCVLTYDPDRPQAAVAEAREADKALKAVRWEADAAARLAAQQHEAAAADAAALRRQLQALAQQGDAQVSELLSEAAALRQQLAQQREEAALVVARAEARGEEAAAAARQRLQQAQGEGSGRD